MINFFTLFVDAFVDTVEFIKYFYWHALILGILGYSGWYIYRRWSFTKNNNRNNKLYNINGNNYVRSRNFGDLVNNSQKTGAVSWPRYAEDFSNLEKKWWQFSDRSSRHIMTAFAAFLIFIAGCYLVLVKREFVVKILVIIYGAGADTLDFVYKNMILPLFVIVLIVGIVYGVYLYKKYQWHKVAEEQRQIYEMVEKIMATLKKHHEDCLAKGNTQPYLAVPHVRDMLIPPNKRKELYPIWDKAVEYFNETESRVRTETQCISGEEYMVWRWLQVAHPNKTDEKVWQGHAFPEEDIPFNMPRYAYFECLKIRGLFDPALETEDDWPEHIQDAILEKLGPAVRVIHMAVDMESKDGCVYMKLASKDEAGQAYKILHGSWFNGRLVSVKYLRPERYLERFPESAKSAVPLRVKKPRHSTAHLR